MTDSTKPVEWSLRAGTDRRNSERMFDWQCWVCPSKAFETRELPPALRSHEIIPSDYRTLEKIAGYVSRDMDQTEPPVVKSEPGLLPVTLTYLQLRSQ